MIVIYTKDNCSYCTRAKKLLTSHNLEYTEFKLNEDFNREELVSKFPTAKTYPVIQIDEEYIGGYTELEQRLGNNLLDTGEFNGA